MQGSQMVGLRAAREPLLGRGDASCLHSIQRDHKRRTQRQRSGDRQGFIDGPKRNSQHKQFGQPRLDG